MFYFLGFTPPEIKCKDPLGIESKKIPATSIVASSQYNQYWGPDRGRLRTVIEGSYGGGWAAQYNDVKQFLQFDLGNVTKVTAVATQGRSNADWMVTSYTLAYSLDGGSFIPYGEGDGQVRFGFRQTPGISASYSINDKYNGSFSVLVGSFLLEDTFRDGPIL